MTIPTLLIFGEEDALAPSHVIETLQSGLPDATLVKLPKAGHFPALEQPEMFNEALDDFLQKVLLGEGIIILRALERPIPHDSIRKIASLE